MRDLHCPAIVILLTPQTVADCQFPGRRVAGVIVASSIGVASPAGQEAERLAAEHGQAVETSEIADGAELVQRIEEIADLYRGETVVVVAPCSAVCDALEWVAAPAHPVALAVDGTGRNVISA